LVFFLLFSSSAAASGTVSNLSLLPCDDPGIRRLRLAKLDRFHAWVLSDLLEVDGTIMDADRCSPEDLVPALLENLGMTPLEMLSLRDGRSSLEARRTISGLGSPRSRDGGDMVSNERWSASGDDIIEAEVVRPSVDEV
jgi:hypothetical protein